MSEDKIRYDILASEALRGIIRTVLQRVQKRGLPGEHHFFINFDTCAPGVIMSKRLKEKYPVDMIIVLQHKFWDLMVFDDRFEVKLAFNNVPERLVIPFAAIKSFADPSVQFGFNPNLFAPTGAEDGDILDVPDIPSSGHCGSRHRFTVERNALPRPVPIGTADRAVAGDGVDAEPSIRQEEDASTGIRQGRRARPVPEEIGWIGTRPGALACPSLSNPAQVPECFGLRAGSTTSASASLLSG